MDVSASANGFPPTADTIVLLLPSASFDVRSAEAQQMANKAPSSPLALAQTKLSLSHLLTHQYRKKSHKMSAGGNGFGA